MNKIVFENPELELIMINANNVICTSLDDDDKIGEDGSVNTPEEEF